MSFYEMRQLSVDGPAMAYRLDSVIRHELRRLQELRQTRDEQKTIANGFLDGLKPYELMARNPIAYGQYSYHHDRHWEAMHDIIWLRHSLKQLFGVRRAGRTG